MTIKNTYPSASTILAEARDLLGPSDDLVDVHPEYTRAVVEMSCRLLGVPNDDRAYVEQALGLRTQEKAETPATTALAAHTIADLGTMTPEQRAETPYAVAMNGLVVRFCDVRTADLYAWLLDTEGNEVQRLIATEQVKVGHTVAIVPGWYEVGHFAL